MNPCDPSGVADGSQRTPSGEYQEPLGQDHVAGTRPVGDLIGSEDCRGVGAENGWIRRRLPGPARRSRCTSSRRTGRDRPWRSGRLSCPHPGCDLARAIATHRQRTTRRAARRSATRRRSEWPTVGPRRLACRLSEGSPRARASIRTSGRPGRRARTTSVPLSGFPSRVAIRCQVVPSVDAHSAVRAELGMPATASTRCPTTANECRRRPYPGCRMPHHAVGRDEQGSSPRRSRRPCRSPRTCHLQGEWSKSARTRRPGE